MTIEELNALIAKAEAGDTAAMNQVAHTYSDDAEFKDLEKAFYWYEKGAEAGDKNSMANLGGWCYLQGNGTEKNIPLAHEWLKKSAENGWVWTWAFNEIANIFVNDAEFKDVDKAFYWYKRSAEAGDALGMSNLGGWCYLWGNGVEKNIPLAIEWLAKAAKMNNIWSMNKLTYIFGELDGYINQEQAAKWFLELIKRDCDPNSGVYEKTGYNKDLYEKVKNAVLNSTTEEEMMSSMSSGGNGSSLLGGVMSFTTSNAKSYINQAETVIQRNINYKEEQRRKAEEERARREAEERARSEREEKEKRIRALIEKIEKNYKKSNGLSCEWRKEELEIIIDDNVNFQRRSIWGGRTESYTKKTLIIPKGVRHIGNYAFSNQSSKLFTCVVLPETITSIGERAFSHSALFGDLIIPNGVERIEKYAFVNHYLSSITLPSSIKNIEEGAFGMGPVLSTLDITLKKIVVPKGTKQRFKQMKGLKGLESKIVEE